MYRRVYRYVNRERKGEKCRDCNRCLHNLLQNQFLQLYAIDIQYDTKVLKQSANNSIFQMICYIIYIMLNSISRGYYVTAYFIQFLHRCADITYVHNSMTRGQRTAHNPMVATLRRQSQSTDLESKSGYGHPLPTYQNFLRKNLFREPFYYTTLLLHKLSFTIYRYFYLQNIFSYSFLKPLSLFLYMCIHIDPKKFYKKLFEKPILGIV